MKNKEDRDIYYDFVIGMKDFNTKGTQVRPVRINKHIKEILLQFIEEDKSNLARKFDLDDSDQQVRIDMFLSTMQFLTNKITGDRFLTIRFNAIIGRELLYWVSDKIKSHNLYDDINFKPAMQWVTNIWSRKYSQAALLIKSDNLTRKRNT